MLCNPLCYPQATPTGGGCPWTVWSTPSSPDTGDGDRADGPGVLPHDVVLGEVEAGTEVVGGPLAGRARRAGELVGQVLVGFARGADPAAVLTWAQPQRNHKGLTTNAPGRHRSCRWRAKRLTIRTQVLQYSAKSTTVKLFKV